MPEAEHQKSTELGEKPIGQLMWKYFLPAFVGVVVYSLYNIVDRIFIGRGVGSIALSGLSSVFPIMLIVMAFGMLIGIGAGVNVSISMGQKDHNKAEKFLGNGLVLMILVSLLVSVLGFLIKAAVELVRGIVRQEQNLSTAFRDLWNDSPQFGQVHIAVRAPSATKGNQDSGSVQVFRVKIEFLIVNCANRKRWRAVARLERCCFLRAGGQIRVVRRGDTVRV